MFEVVGMLLLDFPGQVELRGRRLSNLILWFDVRGIVIRKPLHQMVFLVDHPCDGFHRLIPILGAPLILFIVLHECSTNESFADIGNRFVSQGVFDDLRSGPLRPLPFQ